MGDRESGRNSPISHKIEAVAAFTFSASLTAHGIKPEAQIKFKANVQ